MTQTRVKNMTVAALTGLFLSGMSGAVLLATGGLL